MSKVPGFRRQERLLLPECLDDYIREDNPVRALDLYIDRLDLGSLGFRLKAADTVGRPVEYAPSVLLKVLVYGYLNRIRSSRALEKEAGRNLEVIWLTEKARPDHWTINEFRKVNRAAFKNVLRDFHRLCGRIGLFGKELEAIDGSFFKALNGKAGNFTETKLNRMEARIDAAIEAYDRALDDEAHESGPPPENGVAEEKREELRSKKRRIEELREVARQSPSGQASLVDPDSRLLKKGGQSVVGHNVQCVVDGKHHLIAHIEIVQAGNDSRQLESMAKAACEALEIEPSEERPVDFIADGGYYNSAQVARCEAAGMRMHVPAGKNSVEREEGYRDEDFVHDAQSDEYICPQGMRLRRHADATRKEIVYRIYYDTAVCRGCPCLQRCTGGSYRKLGISQYVEVERKVALRMEQTPEVYARRKGLAEHPFGTMKSVWGYGQFMVMGRAGCEGEMNLMALCYNWKRAIAVVGLKALMEALVGLFRVPRGWFSGLCEPNNLRRVVVHA